MRLRPHVALLSAVVVTGLSGCASSVPTALAGAGKPAAPLLVDLGSPTCQELSGVPGLWLGMKVPTVRVAVRAQSGAGTVPYDISVDGQSRLHGSINPGGSASSNLSVENGKSTRILVTSGQDVVLDRTVFATC